MARVSRTGFTEGNSFRLPRLNDVASCYETDGIRRIEKTKRPDIGISRGRAGGIVLRRFSLWVRGLLLEALRLG